MKELWKNPGFKILVAVTLIMLGLLIYTATSSGSGVSSIFEFITNPLQKISSTISSKTNHLFERKKTVDELYDEIDMLNDELQKLRTLTVDYYDIKKENAQFLKYYDLKQKNKSFKFVSASVIGRDPNENYYGFTLDEGKLLGVSVNDPVITDAGLVGWIYHVDFNSCKVRTILSPNTKVSAVDKVSGDSGIITGGQVSMADQNLTKFSLVPAQNNLKSGDILVTSGLSGMYPIDLKIGEISNIETDEYDASVYAVVRPFEDIPKVKDVFIVTDFVGKGNIQTSTIDEYVNKD